jgi:Holliday junction resolvasome RuvABC endonuclease subunit
MLYRVLSLDVSASSTGWAFTTSKTGKQFDYNLIKTSPKNSLAERLAYFRTELVSVIKKFKPTHVVMEDVFSGLNPKTLIMLSKFAGVTMETIRSVANTEPYIIHTSTVKAYFKAKDKETIFNMIVDILDWKMEEVSFKKHNDLTDAIAQLMCYYDCVLEARSFRHEQPYGYIYEV